MNWHDRCDFGMHYDLHAGLNDTELGAKLTYENLREALEIIQPDWIQCDCKGHAGYTSWPTKVGTPSPGIVKDALKIHSQVCHDLKIPLGMHYSGVFDMVACDKHPDWEAKNKDGVKYDHPVLRSVCQNSPYYDQLMIPQLLELIENYDVNGFWVDGDGWALLPCYCDKCKKGFIEKYNIEPPTSKDDVNWHLWCNYHRDLFMKNTKKCADAVHKKKPSCLYISNWMYTYGAPIEEREGTDYISGDLSPLYGQKSALLEGHFLTNRQRDWDLMIWGFLNTNEKAKLTRSVKSLLHISQEAAMILSCGGAVMIYGKPQRNGLLNPWHSKKYAQVRDFVKARAEFNRHSESVSDICVIQNPNDYFEDTKIPDNLFDLNIEAPAYLKGIGASQLLSECHYNYDIKPTYMLKGHLKDYKLIIINEQSIFEDDFIKELKDYVSNGGKLLISGIKGLDKFSELLGVNIGDKVNGEFRIESENETTTLEGPYIKVSNKSANVFRYIMKEEILGLDETENPYITFNNFGKGLVVGIYSKFFENYANNMYPRTRGLFRDVIEKLQIETLVDQIDAPSYVFINLREKDNKYIVNLVNTGSVISSVDRPFMVEELPMVPSIKFRIKLDKEPNDVTLCPSKSNIRKYYKEGYLYVTVSNLNLMESVVIEK